MSSLKLNGVNKIYPSGESALFNIEFQTKDKEFIVIVGGEASGKSTLLRIIAGLEGYGSALRTSIRSSPVFSLAKRALPKPFRPTGP